MPAESVPAVDRVDLNVVLASPLVLPPPGGRSTVRRFMLVGTRDGMAANSGGAEQEQAQEEEPEENGQEDENE